MARKRVYTDGGANVAAGFAEDFNKKIRGSIDDLRRIGKFVDGVYVAIHREDRVDCIERAQLALNHGKLSECTGASCRVALFNSAIGTHGAGDDTIRVGGDHPG